MSSTNKTIVAMLAVVGLAIAFWALLLSPKRQEASKLDETVSSLKQSLAADRQQVTEALAARKGFAADYGQLVVLGKAVPADDETASLLVQVNHIATGAGVRFQEIQLSSSGSGSEAPAPAPAPESSSSSTATPTSAPAPAAPTEAAAATLPLGATVGPAGLDVMPYSLKFTGDFFHVADFIHGLDELVKTANSHVAVDGRLITVDGFSLGPQQGSTFPSLEANFAVTAYLTPPSQGITAGATPTVPAPATATPASTTTGGTP
jgi:Tfp pilus assembly protein PilO